jgi:hypothetical protein
MRHVTLALLALLPFSATPAASAQVLDGQWFKVVISANGEGLPPEATEAEPDQVKPLVRYAYFALAEGVGISYDVTAWTPVEGGGWSPDYDGSVTMMDPAETFVSSGSITTSRYPLSLGDGAPNLVQVNFNGPVKTKLDGEELVSASIKSLGATSYFTNDSYAFLGRGKVKLTRVPVDKLPFEVKVQSAPAPRQEAPAASAAPATATAPAAAPGAP